MGLTDVRDYFPYVERGEIMTVTHTSPFDRPWTVCGEESAVHHLGRADGGGHQHRQQEEDGRRPWRREDPPSFATSAPAGKSYEMNTMYAACSPIRSVQQQYQQQLFMQFLIF